MTAGAWEEKGTSELLNEKQRKSKHRGEMKQIFKQEAGNQTLNFIQNLRAAA